MIITRTSAYSGIERSMDLPVKQEQLDEWNNGNGSHIQNVFPHLTADQREFILTGVTTEEWNSLFGKDEEEEFLDEFGNNALVDNDKTYSNQEYDDEDDVPLDQDRYDRGEIQEL